MISLPVITEEQVKAKLREVGYEPTDHVSATGRFWKHKDANRHLMVPISADGYYPDWLLDEVVQRARAIGDEICATGVAAISPWERLRPKRDRPKSAD
jgi:hypothetical protein